MTKSRFNLRNVAKIGVTCLAVCMMAVACGKDDKDKDPDENSVPTAPLNFNGVATEKTVALTWSEPANLNGATITGYQVSKDGGDNWVTASSVTGHTFTELTGNTEYKFRVRATSNKGPGAYAEKTIKTTTGGSSEPEGWPPANVLSKYGLDGMKAPTGFSNGFFIETSGSGIWQLTISFDGNASTVASVKSYFSGSDWILETETSTFVTYEKTVSGTNYGAYFVELGENQFKLQSSRNTKP